MDYVDRDIHFEVAKGFLVFTDDNLGEPNWDVLYEWIYELRLRD